MTYELKIQILKLSIYVVHFSKKGQNIAYLPRQHVNRELTKMPVTQLIISLRYTPITLPLCIA